MKKNDSIKHSTRKTPLVRMSLAQVRQARGATDWHVVDALTDAQIAKAIQTDPDAAPILTEEFLRTAEMLMTSVDAKKVMVSMRLDKDVIEAFKRSGPGYQARINAVLRAWAQTHRV